RIAGEASDLADYLAELDSRLSLQREDSLALGFPSTGENADRSRLRYATQFVASMTKDGTPWGLLPSLGLAAVTTDDGAKIQLTNVGWRFAVLENPVLDGGGGPDRFSPTETSFLLEHIASSVPNEDFAYRTILEAVRSGKVTPERLDRVCQEYVPANLRRE